MADSFMIMFPFNGKRCYANVYARAGTPGKFFIHIVNPQICPGLPNEMTFVQEGGKLRYSGNQELPGHAELEIAKALEAIKK